jgi:hypothetical protein
MKFYHGKGISSGANNVIVLKLKAVSWSHGHYAEFLVILNLTLNTSLDRLTVVPIVSTGDSNYPTPNIALPEVIITGSASAGFDLWIKKPAMSAALTAELVGYDEVSAEDTLLKEPLGSSDPVPVSVLPTQISGSYVGENYSSTEVNTGGTWIDGKPIYKQTVTTSGPSSLTAPANGKYYRTGITADTLVKAETIVKLSNGTILTAPSVYNSGGFNRINVSPLKANDHVLAVDSFIPVPTDPQDSGAVLLNAVIYVTFYYTK